MGFPRRTSVLAVIIAPFAASCGDVNVPVNNDLSAQISASFVVRDIEPAAAKPGSTVRMLGDGFVGDMKLTLADQSTVAFELVSTKEIRFVVPANASGMVKVRAEKAGESMQVPMVILTEETGEKIPGPVVEEKPGGPATGGSTDEPLPVCSKHGQVDCIASKAFPAADSSVNVGLAPLCAGDGQLACITSAAYPAADVAQFTATDLLAGKVVAGVAGSGVVESHADCAVDGQESCVTTAAFKAARMANFNSADVRLNVEIAGVTGVLSGAPNACSFDGETGCLANSNYASAEMLGIADKVLSSAHVGGQAGNVTLPASTNVLTGVSYGVGGNGLSGTLTLPPASRVRAVNGAYGIGGTSESPSLQDCGSDGDAGCVVVGPSFAAAATLGAGSKILFGQSVAGVSGNVTLPDAGKVSSGTFFGVSGNGSAGTLTLPMASNVLTGSGTYGDPGAAVTPSYTPDFPPASKVHTSATVNFSPGTLTLPSVDNVVVSNGDFGIGGNGSSPTLTLPLASNVLASNGVFGVGGNGSTPTLTLPDAGDVLLGSGSYGVAGTGSSPTLTLPAPANVLSSNGAFGVGGTGSSPTLTLPLAANVLDSNGAFGVAGSGSTPTLVLPDAGNVLAGNGAFGAGGNGSTPTLTLPPQGKVLTSITYGVGGNGSAGTLTLPDASEVLIGTGTYGDPSAAFTPSYTPDFPLPSLVHASTTVDGHQGTLTLPAPGHVLAANGAFGIGGNGTTPTLTLPPAGNVVASSGVFGVDGNATTPTLTLPDADHVLATSGAFGVAGNGSNPTLTLPAQGRVLTGTSYGVAGNGSGGTLTLPSASNVLTGSGTYGDPGAFVTPSYSPDFPPASKVHTSATVNTSPGTLTLPVGSNVLTSNGAFGIAGNGSTPTLTLPAAGNVLASSGDFGVAGTGTTPTLTLPAAGNVVTANGAFGVNGNGTSPTLTLPAAANVLASSGAFGVNGNGTSPTLTLPAVGNVLSTSGNFGVGGNGSTPTLTLPAAAHVLSSNGAFGVSGTGTTPSLTLPSAANVLTVNGAYGIGGNGSTPAATLPGAGNVLASNGAFGVNGNGSTPTLTLPAPGKVLTTTSYGIAGSGSSGTLTLPAATNVLTGSGTYGDPGAALTPSFSPDFPHPSLVHSSTTVNTVQGTLTLPTPAQVQNSIQYGAAGTGLTGTAALYAVCGAAGSSNCAVTTGSGFLAAESALMIQGNIRHNVTVGGVTGNFGPTCATDGGDSCYVSPAGGIWKAANMTGWSPWDLRDKGAVTLAGLSGKLEFRRSGTASWNFTGAPASATTNEIFDTVDDYNNGGATVGASPWGAPFLAMLNHWQPITSGGAPGGPADCNAASDDCVYKDLTTGLMWTEENPQTGLGMDINFTKSWANALSACNGLTFNGMTGWRLPTSKEVLQAHINGLAAVAKSNGLFANAYDMWYYYIWSATTESSGTTRAIAIDPMAGVAAIKAKSTDLSWLCVR